MKQKTKEQIVDFPNLHRLGIQVHSNPSFHILINDLKKVLDKKQIERFHEYFGIQTCPCVKNGPAVYPWDAEAVLERMFSGRLTGTQHPALWD